ncbi:hypothetical protein TTHERM_01248860 (macronuclear) [Tetrahymena thermophila SB210]|uniref:Uncharacterized protein n=1 Tax=Tetrahymena thermophila (strain SB210) TaxID=312017 RepID=Q22AC2_TETTS|nr:hypothetical protein TTHERM_01248860 [Tetrahymena thermophila SB210]EAR82227.2 hypothetical protein TTHERM_01248860 [Tetrahymena thermophila SB210]|eukprot:XP_001029890.2 hypothetical protein TTHERM_01248860 [Tetrahymena thermophila SB210]
MITEQTTNQVEKRSPIFSITIEIAEEKHHLHIFKYDTPSQIAYRFCIQNNWDLACVTPVSKKIQEVFEQYLRNPQLEPKLRRKLEQIIPNEGQNSKQNLEQNTKGIQNSIQEQQDKIKTLKGLTITDEKDSNQKQAESVYIQKQMGNQMQEQDMIRYSKVNQEDLNSFNGVNHDLDNRNRNLYLLDYSGVNTPQNNNTNNTHQQNNRNSNEFNKFQQNMMEKKESSGTLQSNQSNSKKYFNYSYIANKVQEQAMKKIDEKKQKSEQKKRSNSLDNTSSQSQLNFKCVPPPPLLNYNQMSKDSSTRNIQFSEVISVPFKDANSIQFRDTHSTNLKENLSSNLFKEGLSDSRKNIQNLTSSKSQNQNSNSKINPYSKILREQNQNGSYNEMNYFRGLKESFLNGQNYSSVLKQMQNESKSKGRDSKSSLERASQQNNIKKDQENWRGTSSSINMKDFINNQNCFSSSQKPQIASNPQINSENKSKYKNQKLESNSLGRNNGNNSSNLKQNKKQMQSGSLSPPRSTRGLDNPTLYERGIHFLDQKQNKIEQFKQNTWDRMMSACTFIPQTNQKANEHLLQYRDKSMDPYNQLYQNSKVIQIKKDLIKNKLMNQEIKEFSFKPSLNPISQLIIKTKRQNSISENTSNFENQKTTKISQIQQEMLKECTFHPKISKHSEKIHKTHNGNTSVYDRLYVKTNKKNSKGEKQQSQQQQQQLQCNNQSYQNSQSQQNSSNYQNTQSYQNNQSYLNNQNYYNNNQFITYPDQEGNNYFSESTQFNNQNNNQTHIQNQDSYNQQYFNSTNYDDAQNQQNGYINSNNYYNPQSENAGNVSFSQDKHGYLSYQQNPYQQQLLSSDFFNNSQASNNSNSLQFQNNNNSQNNNKFKYFNNKSQQMSSTLTNQQHQNTFNQNTSNNLSLVNQSDLNLSSTQINFSQQALQDLVHTQDNFKNLHNDLQSSEQINFLPNQNDCNRSFGDTKNNNSFIVSKTQNNPSQASSQGKKIVQNNSAFNSQNSQFKNMERQSLNESRDNKNPKPKKDSSENAYKRSFSPNKNSIALMEKKKRQRFEEIFILLDSDKDGLISAQNISIQDLPDEILVIIAPLLYELEDMDAELTLLEFMDAFERLFKQLSLIDKNKLLLFDTYQKWQYEKIQLHQKDANFQPQINPQSEIIAQISRPERGSENLYDLYKEKDRICEEKLMQKRREKENEINQQCTFHPNINHTNNLIENNKTVKDPSQINTCQKSFQEFMQNHTKII